MERQPLLDLLKLSMGLSDGFEPLDRDGWASLYCQARDQAVLGITLSGLDALPRELGAPLKIYCNWAYACERICIGSQKRLELAAVVSRKFSEAGFPCCILKGQSVARFYPQPMLRQSGDVDIWVPAGRKKVLDYLRSQCKVGAVVYHHCECGIGGNAGEVEVHFTPSWMNSPLLNRRLQKYFSECAPAETSRPDRELGFCVSSSSFAFIFGVVHFWRHMLDEGIGLRHLVDLYYTVRALDPQSFAEIAHRLQSFGLYRLGRALSGALVCAFEMSPDALPIPPDTASGELLLRDVLASGNFGRSDSRLRSRDVSRFRSALDRFRRSMRYVRFCPSDVLWSPLFKLGQLVWRAVNHYL